MSREIKFRKYHQELEDMTFWDGSKGSNNLFWYTLTEYPEMYHLMQYTGLKDKNGIDVYEGDIVESLDEETRSCVVFMECSFNLKRNEVFTGLRYYSMNRIEVIGNIYQNPDLLL